MSSVPRPVHDLESDPAVVVIPDDTEGSMDEWLASLPRDEPPIELPLPAAELIAEAHPDSAW